MSWCCWLWRYRWECKLWKCCRVEMLGVRVAVLGMVVLGCECWLWEPVPPPALPQLTLSQLALLQSALPPHHHHPNTPYLHLQKSTPIPHQHPHLKCPTPSTYTLINTRPNNHTPNTSSLHSHHENHHPHPSIQQSHPARQTQAPYREQSHSQLDN